MTQQHPDKLNLISLLADELKTFTGPIQSVACEAPLTFENVLSS